MKTESQSTKRLVALLCVVLVLGSFLTFLPAIHHDFINYDDDEYVTSNSDMQSGLTWANLAWTFRSRSANWHPLTWMSHLLDFQLYGLKPWGHHLTSVLVHSVNTLMAFLVLLRLTGATWRSFFAAALFGLHPLRVESVAWVAERKDVLSTLFWLLTLLAYARYVKESMSASAPSSAAKPKVFYLAALFLFILGLMSKPMLVTLPFVLLLLDYWPLRRISDLADGQGRSSAPVTCFRLVLEKVPFFLLAAAMSFVAFVVQRNAGVMKAMGAWPLSARVGNALVSYCRYLGKLFYPAHLAVFYPHPGHWPVQTVLLAGLLLLGITISVLALSRRCPYLPVGWFWFLGTLVPTIGLVQVGMQSMADRYSYVPSLGLLILFVWGTHDLTKQWSYRRAVLHPAAGILVLLCAALAVKQESYWQNSQILFRHALAVTGRNYVAYWHLGDYYSERGSAGEAIEMYRQTIQIAPGCLEAHDNLGKVFLAQGRTDEAIGEFEQAIRLKPDHARAHSNLGVALCRQGRLQDALGEFREAVNLKPDYADARLNLGIALLLKGAVDEAIVQLQEATRLNSSDPGAHYNLGLALENRERLDEALNQFEETARLQPGDAGARISLGGVLARKGRTDEAIGQFEKAITLDSKSAEAHYKLGAVLAAAGRRDEAIAQLTEALKLQPDNAEAAQQLRALSGSSAH